MKSLFYAAAITIAVCSAAFAGAQSSQPTKTAPVAGIETEWMNGLSGNDIRIVKEIMRGKADQDRWMIMTAIVRNREASRDMYRGERLTNDKVLANVRVRMSTEESNKWTQSWAHFTYFDRQGMIKVLRDDIAHVH